MKDDMKDWEGRNERWRERLRRKKEVKIKGRKEGKREQKKRNKWKEGIKFIMISSFV